MGFDFRRVSFPDHGVCILTGGQDAQTVIHPAYTDSINGDCPQRMLFIPALVGGKSIVESNVHGGDRVNDS